MPHLTVEYSANIIEKDNIHDLFQLCHSTLVSSLPTDIHTCKSRAIEYSQFLVGNGDAKNAFVHVNLCVLPGRSQETLEKTSHQIMEILQAYFSISKQQLNLSFSIEIKELATTYFKA